MAEVIVTRDSIKAMLNSSNKDYVMHVIGRALVSVYKGQTEAEKATDSTNVDNGVGFSGFDAESGSKSARKYMKDCFLPEFVIEKWTRIDSRTKYPKICKYHRQLNAAALKKLERA